MMNEFKRRFKGRINRICWPTGSVQQTRRKHSGPSNSESVGLGRSPIIYILISNQVILLKIVHQPYSSKIRQTVMLVSHRETGRNTEGETRGY